MSGVGRDGALMSGVGRFRPRNPTHGVGRDGNLITDRVHFVSPRSVFFPERRSDPFDWAGLRNRGPLMGHPYPTYVWARHPRWVRTVESGRGVRGVAHAAEGSGKIPFHPPFRLPRRSVGRVVVGPVTGAETSAPRL